MSATVTDGNSSRLCVIVHTNIGKVKHCVYVHPLFIKFSKSIIVQTLVGVGGHVAGIPFNSDAGATYVLSTSKSLFL